jgi:hypothetical protein
LLASLGSIRHAAEKERDTVDQAGITEWDCDCGNLTNLLVGFYPPEVWTDLRAYQWSSPTGAIVLPLPPGNYRLLLNIAPTGNWGVRNPKFFVNGIPVHPVSIEETESRLSVQMECGKDPFLSWTCDAFEPKTSGLPDERQLGVALVSVEALRRDDGQIAKGKGQ